VGDLPCYNKRGGEEAQEHLREDTHWDCEKYAAKFVIIMRQWYLNNGTEKYAKKTREGKEEPQRSPRLTVMHQDGDVH